MNKDLKKVIQTIKSRIELNSIIIEVNENNTELITELKGENIALQYVLALISKEIEKNLNVHIIY
jgi:hypothetical protein